MLSAMSRTSSACRRVSVLANTCCRWVRAVVRPLIDLNMMVMTGGAERTQREYQDLLSKSGFRLDRIVATKSPFSVIEASPV